MTEGRAEDSSLWPSAFRHAHASLLLRTGATPRVVQELSRHADPRVTLGMYSHVIGEDRRNAAERVAALLSQQVVPIAPKFAQVGNARGVDSMS